jgi:hypothetical protein
MLNNHVINKHLNEIVILTLLNPLIELLVEN